MDTIKTHSQSYPNHFEDLSSSDQTDYKKLRDSLCVGRNKRGNRLNAFTEMLEEVRKYAIRNDEDDWKRCMICGVCWVDNGIAINTRQLQHLTDKCKSSINGSLHRVGYNPSASPGDVNASLIEKIPLLKGNFSELRQWTVRQQSITTPQPMINKNFRESRATPFMSPEAHVPNGDIFNLPAIQPQISPNIVKDGGNDLYFDPFCLPMNDWNEKETDFGNNYDIFYP